MLLHGNFTRVQVEFGVRRACVETSKASKSANTFNEMLCVAYFKEGSESAVAASVTPVVIDVINEIRKCFNLQAIAGTFRYCAVGMARGFT